MSENEWPKPTPPPDVVQQIADGVGGTITECAALPDGSGFAIMSMPLPTDHWSIQQTEHYEAPPMVFQMGSRDAFQYKIGKCGACSLNKREFAELIKGAGKYAYRASTMNGKEPDLDPDALLQNLVVAFLGYWTDSGLSSEEWANPRPTGSMPPPTSGQS